MTDPLDILRTHEGATPGEWVFLPLGTHWVVEVRDTDWTWVVKVHRSAEDARHIATWDPETTRDVVGILEALHRECPVGQSHTSIVGKPYWAYSCPYCNAAWMAEHTPVHGPGCPHAELDALLARVRERMGS